MSGNLFIPKVYKPEDQIHTEVPEAAAAAPATAQNKDRITQMIQKIVQYMVVALMFLVPVFFIPGLPASLGFDKALIALTVGLAIVLFGSLLALRFRKVTTVLPLPLFAFWGFVAVAFLGGLLSGDIQDALRGSVFETQTASFFAVMALMMTVPLILQQSKLMSLRVLIAFGAAAVALIAYILLRVTTGLGFLSLGSFGNITFSPIGTFNDLAIFAALVVLLGLVALLQLPLRKGMQYGVAALVAASLIIMALVNFFHLWIVIGFFALLLLVYTFTRDTLFAQASDTKAVVSPVLIGATMLVCVVSILFVIAGEYLGGQLNALTKINYVEVRPSVTATIDVARAVYKEDVLLGVGPNRFADAWRLHKDPSINDTLFWNTDFNAGFGFIPTIFVNLGVLGGLAILIFHGLYLYTGSRMLLKGNSADSFWYFFGVTTFVAAVFLWGMSYVYVSGPAILLLAALFTGLSFVAYQALVPSASRTIPLVSSRRQGFFLMTMVIIVITASVSVLFTVGKQYVAQAQFTDARLTAQTPDEFEQKVGMAASQYRDDVFVGALAQAKLITLRQMLGIQEPTEEDQQRFLATAGQAIELANYAITLDPSNPDAHATLADILIILAAAGIDDAENRANGKLEDARWRDPLNPGYDLMGAYMAVQLNDLGQAKERINKALQLKRNFSEALFLSSQIDIREGNIDGAIGTTQAIISLEPNNPTRYYQLGVLYAAKKDNDSAIAAYEAAISRDQDFANARYMLALSLIDAKRLDDALAQLRIVQQTNQDNEQLKSLITQLETNGLPTASTTDLGSPVNEQTPAQGNGDAVVSPNGAPDTDLVTPVNTVGEEEGNAAPAPQAASAGQ
ncbi:MAG TPA: tetratricopeptide repeat protein [Candidatus Paceibacterota bacterium]